jgi:RimJ/RimL family protein N-acetyltransferase
LNLLVPFESKHVSATYEWVQDTQLRNDFLLRREISHEGHIRYFDRLLTDTTQKICAIIFEECHVGNCGFKSIDYTNNCGELWIYIGKYSHRGKGIGKNATRQLLENGFNQLSFERIYLHVAESNERALAMYKKIGFITAPCNGCIGWADRDTPVVHMELSRAAWLEINSFGARA